MRARRQSRQSRHRRHPRRHWLPPPVVVEHGAELRDERVGDAVSGGLQLSVIVTAKQALSSRPST